MLLPSKVANFFLVVVTGSSCGILPGFASFASSRGGGSTSSDNAGGDDASSGTAGDSGMPPDSSTGASDPSASDRIPAPAKTRSSETSDEAPTVPGWNRKYGRLFSQSDCSSLETNAGETGHESP